MGLGRLLLVGPLYLLGQLSARIWCSHLVAAERVLGLVLLLPQRSMGCGFDQELSLLLNPFGHVSLSALSLFAYLAQVVQFGCDWLHLCLLNRICIRQALALVRIERLIDFFR